jgi:hypothetical protein
MVTDRPQGRAYKQHRLGTTALVERSLKLKLRRKAKRAQRREVGKALRAGAEERRRRRSALAG